MFFQQLKQQIAVNRHFYIHQNQLNGWNIHTKINRFLPVSGVQYRKRARGITLQYGL